MNEQITEIINTLSAKLGVASQYIVTEMAKYKIASNIVPLLVGIIALVMIRFIYIKTNKFLAKVNEIEAARAKKHDETPDVYGWFKFDEYNGTAIPMLFAWAAMTIFSFMAIIFLACSLSDIVTWLIAPTGSMINYILNAIK